ncbi:MAG: hypothetical protein HC847_07290 [Hydrococcus sp. RU_2_2]|nr:hypothetical protein [Hydrococcus sp. RU_2_2]
MSVNASGGSPVANPLRYQTIPLSVISQAEQQDRTLKHSELDKLLSYFRSGTKLLQIVDTLAQNADRIVAAGGNRIFGAAIAWIIWKNPLKKLIYQVM